MNPRVSNLHQAISQPKYKDESDTTRVGVKITKNGKLKVAIGGNNPYDTAGRRVRQLRHTIAQLGKTKDEKTSYESSKLKQFVEEQGGKPLADRLAKAGVFRGKVTFGDLKAIVKEFEEEAKKAELHSKETLQNSLHPGLAPEPQVSKKNLLPQTPKAQAKNHWLKRASKKEKAAAREKAFLNGPRNLSFRDLSEADQASIKTLVESKLASLKQDQLGVIEKENNFKSSAQQKLEQHANKFPDLMRFATMASPNKSIKYKTPELAQKAIRDKLADIDTLIKNLQAEHVELEGKDKDRMDQWIGSVKALLSAWRETNYLNLDPKALGFVDDFCKQAESAFDTYHALALKAKNINLAYTELEAIAEEPMDRLLKEPSLSPEGQGLLLQELARFTSQNAELKGFEKYEAFVEHLNKLGNRLEPAEDVAFTFPELTDTVHFDPIVVSDNPWIPESQAFDAFLAQEAAKEAEASRPSNLQVPTGPNREAGIPLQEKHTEGSPRAEQPSKAFFDLLIQPNNRQNLNLALKAYAQKRNQMTQLIQAKLLGQGEGMASLEEIYKTNDKIRNWVIQEMAPRITSQSLSLEEMDTIDKRITLYVVSKNEDLLLSLQFNEQDESLRELLKRKISQMDPSLPSENLEKLSQDLLDQWYQSKEASSTKSLMSEAQIEKFLNDLKQA